MNFCSESLLYKQSSKAIQDAYLPSEQSRHKYYLSQFYIKLNKIDFYIINLACFSYNFCKLDNITSDDLAKEEAEKIKKMSKGKTHHKSFYIRHYIWIYFQVFGSKR